MNNKLYQFVNKTYKLHENEVLSLEKKGYTEWSIWYECSMSTRESWTSTSVHV